MKNVTSLLKPNKKHLSLVFGNVALGTIIPNMRFYGHEIRGEDQTTHVRFYSADKPLDDHTTLVKLLFPSPTGQLTPAKSCTRKHWEKHYRSQDCRFIGSVY